MPIYDILGNDESCNEMGDVHTTDYSKYYAPFPKDPSAPSDRFYDKPSIEETIPDDPDRQLQIVELEIERAPLEDHSVFQRILEQLGDFPY